MSAHQQAYQYVVLRCVPRVDREEFVNIGVVLFSQQTDVLCSSSHVHEERLLALWPELDVAAVRASLAMIDAVCKGDQTAGAAATTSASQRFGWLAAPRSTVVQPGPTHGGVTGDLARQLEHLVEALVR